METSTSTNTEKSVAKKELEPGFDGETMTLSEAVSLSDKSKVTILKIIKDKKIKSVGKVVSGARGRPANLYSRSQLLEAIHNG